MKRYVARQPILDLKERVFGYELLFRSGLDNYFRGENGDQATSRVMVDSALVFSLETLTGGRRAFLNFTQDLIISQSATFLPLEQAVIEVLENVKPTDEVIDACKSMKQKGYLIALDDFVPRNEMEPLIQLADIIKIDFQLTDPNIRKAIVEKYAPLGIKLLAEKVETREQFLEAKNLGYSYFQGFFFCKPEVFSSKDIPIFKLNYIGIMNEINREEPNFNEIEKLIKQEASFTYKLLRYLNSAAFMFEKEITSIRHALALLGVQEIRKLTSLMALAAMGQDKPGELVANSVVRGKFCESIAPKIGFRDRASELFFVGLLSSMDAILERPMEQIVEEVKLTRDVKEALLRRDSCFGNVCGLMEAYERGDWEKTQEISSLLRLDEAAAASSYLEALRWGNQIYNIGPPPKINP
jgi:c-di-GMP-related signal transduction protein